MGKHGRIRVYWIGILVSRAASGERSEVRGARPEMQDKSEEKSGGTTRHDPGEWREGRD
jgi:hypothetical protein